MTPIRREARAKRERYGDPDETAKEDVLTHYLGMVAVLRLGDESPTESDFARIDRITGYDINDVMLPPIGSMS